jgi:DNA-binding MarR family transcriptional regulator
MCNRLVTRGLVARKPSALDRREVVIELSLQGQGLVDAVMDKRRQEIDAVVGRMSPDDRDRVIASLDLFAQAADESAGSGIDHDHFVPSVAPAIPQTN